MTPWHIRIGIAIVCRLVPLIIGIRYWKRFNFGERALLVLFAYDIISIVIGAHLAIQYRNNLIMGNIYTLVEITTVTIFFNQFITNNSARNLLKWFLVIFGIVHIVTTIFYFGIHSGNPASSAIKGLYIIALSTISIGHLFNKHDKWYKKGLFVILVGWLSFYMFNIGYLTMSYWLIESNSKFTWPLHLFLTYSYYVMSLLFTIGFYLIAKERRELLL